jgi:hypothetical protein
MKELIERRKHYMKLLTSNDFTTMSRKELKGCIKLVDEKLKILKEKN